MRKAITDFNMIENGDKIAVGISGGKDSTMLLYSLKKFQYFSPVEFQIEAITLDMGFKGMNFKPIENFCKEIDVPYIIKKTQIGEIVFNERKEKNPCALCARMKRGALHDAALERDCRVVALGHHLDDAVETFFMSLFYEGRINTFKPKTYLDRKDIYVIRPLIYANEKQIIGAIKNSNIEVPVVESTCPADGYTKREEIKVWIKELKKQYPKLEDRMISAFKNKEQTNLWF
jgi:tRNA(Ile)-lysidine synthase TilS/MesJ